MSDSVDIRPLIPESSTSESTTVEVVMNDLRDQNVRIPDYQRDSDQWAEPTKSLLVESVINNLSIPAFFFEVMLEGGVEKNDVIDGQQRLTTLDAFFRNKLRLVDSEDAPYLSPHSVHYAKKTFCELPPAYQQAFKRYRLTVIKLRNLGNMRLEIFRRINQGGTPLSGQDLRLAYFGETSPSLALIRLVGIYDPHREAAKRFLKSARGQFSLSYPWNDQAARTAWQDWWENKEIARGQTPSETFLWSLVVSQAPKLDTILKNKSALEKLGTRFDRAIDEALDTYCAQLRYQDNDASIPPALMTFQEMRDRFFPYFELWIGLLLGQKGVNLPVSRHRMVAAVIGAAYQNHIDTNSLSNQRWTNLVEFVRRPQDISAKFGEVWPVSKGRWDGAKGYRAQITTAQTVVQKLCE
jgi:hypothetical protein